MEITINGGVLGGKIPFIGCVAGQNVERLRRINYGKIDMEKNICLFPAFPPFLSPVLNDLRTMFPDAVYTDKALAVIEAAEKMAETFRNKTLDPNFQFKTKPYAHQIASLLYAVNHPRTGLLLDCGTGKSKSFQKEWRRKFSLWFVFCTNQNY